VLPPSLGDHAALFYLKFKLAARDAATSFSVLQFNFSAHFSCLDCVVLQEISSLF
jgi:hypothetical protein